MFINKFYVSCLIFENKVETDFCFSNNSVLITTIFNSSWSNGVSKLITYEQIYLVERLSGIKKFL